MPHIRKKELEVITKALACARDYLPETLIWKWDKKTTWGELLSGCHKAITRLQCAQYEENKKLTAYITAKRHNDPEYRKRHADAQKRYLEKKRHREKIDG